MIIVWGMQVSTTLGAAIPEERKKNGWIEGVAIWVAVLVVICVGAGNDWQKDRQFRKLNAQREAIHVKVVRNHEQVNYADGGGCMCHHAGIWDLHSCMRARPPLRTLHAAERSAHALCGGLWGKEWGSTAASPFMPMLRLALCNCGLYCRYGCCYCCPFLTQVLVDNTDVVVGDILLLDTGDKVRGGA